MSLNKRSNLRKKKKKRMRNVCSFLSPWRGLPVGGLTAWGLTGGHPDRSAAPGCVPRRAVGDLIGGPNVVAVGYEVLVPQAHCDTALHPSYWALL